MTQADKAQAFRTLHQRGNPLMLYNIWDAGSAKTVADAGALAVATGSWSVAAAQGYEDGEEIPLDLLVMIAKRITATVDVPLSVDMEGGYAVAPAELRENVKQIIKAGAVGMNFEDRVVKGSGLHPIEEQAQRISAIREVETAFFINARTDLFLQAEANAHADLVSDAITRGKAYAKAGADGFFVPGLVDTKLIAEICDGVDLPVNVMMAPNAPSVDVLAELGVGRVSHGPFPYRKAMVSLKERFQAETG